MIGGDYLKSNTIVREEIINLKLFHELKLAAAARHYHLKIFESNVDFEGFDVILDDNRLTGKYQIKTKWDSNVSSWHIHRNMLFPRKVEATEMRLDNGALCSNVEKGVILLDVKEQEVDFSLDIYFTNFFIIRAVSHGFIKRPIPTRKKATEKLNELLGMVGRPNEKIRIGKGVFVKLKDAMSLLAICGFDNDKDVNPKQTLRKFYKERKNIIPGIATDQLYNNTNQILREELDKILDENVH